MKNLIMLLITLFLLNFANAQWIQKNSMYNYGRVSAVGCSLNGKGYVGLGQIYNSIYINDFWEYNTASELWSRKADYPGGGRNGASAYAANGKIYVFFGIDNSLVCHNDVWEYDPATDTWLQKADFPGQGRLNARGFVFGDSTIYIGTGSYQSTYNYLYDFWQYSPKTDTWQQKTDFPGGKRMAAVSFVLNDKGYLGSGLRDGFTPTNDFWSYDPTNDSWSGIPDLPASPRLGLVSFVIGNEAYVGTGDDYTDFNVDFWKYNDSDSSSWTQVVSPPTQVRLGGISFTIDNVGYFGTGWDKKNYFTDFWAFDPNFATDKKETLKTVEYKIYPVPSNSKLIIEYPHFEKETMLSIYNLNGLKLIEQKLTGIKTQIDISSMKPGVYLVKIKNTKGVETKTILKI